MRISISILLVSILIFWISGCKRESLNSKMAPNGGYALTFDDDDIEAWYAIKNLLENYNTRATFYVTNVSQLTESQVEILFELESAGHEIGFHGQNHLEVNDYIRNNSLDDYIRNEIISGYDAMAAQGFSPSSFAYPGGSRNKTSDRELLKYFKLIRGVSESQRHIPAHNIDQIDEVYYDFDGSRVIYGLGIDNQLEISIEDLKSGFARARDKQEVLILYCHKPASTNSDYEINTNYLESVLMNARDMGLKSFRISDLFK